MPGFLTFSMYICWVPAVKPSSCQTRHFWGSTWSTYLGVPDTNGTQPALPRRRVRIIRRQHHAFQATVAAQEGYGHRHGHGQLGEQLVQIVHAGDGVVAQGDDQVI